MLCLGFVCIGAPEAMQHPDYADREREHGARGEGKGREKEKRPKECLSEFRIHPIYKKQATELSKLQIISHEH